MRESLGCDYVNYVGGHDVKKVALVSGDGKDYYKDALQSGADVYLTGSLNYNMMVEAAEEKMNVVEAGHFYTCLLYTSPRTFSFNGDRCVDDSFNSGLSSHSF